MLDSKFGNFPPPGAVLARVVILKVIVILDSLPHHSSLQGEQIRSFWCLSSHLFQLGVKTIIKVFLTLLDSADHRIVALDNVQA